MDWSVGFTKIGERDLQALDRPMRQAVIEGLEKLAGRFEGVAPAPLHGEWKGFFKLRVGDWRIMYTFGHLQKRIIVHIIDHRSKIYKRHI